ncbi:MAG: flavin reductase family protein [Mesorhizobium sp.]|uniref:flavin reductase family protein n=1 Tax=Mesorhizobium sp. TaxID=1871066 RepID=UPI000FE45B57|nr:flavin reductase family protein [Mesorhizobium sp.]RWM07158.1 MAG: flavin reductase [Mesorhizobium sp.]RWM28516.1 MAG: flavin reductase [Mesorhizobium sp.]TIO50515.1 MAG: flavin reductase family protein [Mesorhizobium sp.]TIO59288.1 MAG: flavin reductase family protein [Mesorhizobium sp.]TIO76982.1 MAG: flavin reductase family protein [Mesorhizobium sp.]
MEHFVCDPRLLRNAFGRFATGVTVVTTGTADGPVAITANSFSSVSLDPPLVLWSIGRHSRRFDAFANAAYYAIHVLADDQIELCWRFSKSGTDFAGLELTWNGHGVPLLPRALARFECSVADRFPAGDHMILLGRVLELETQEGLPLLFAGGKSRPQGDGG